MIGTVMADRPARSQARDHLRDRLERVTVVSTALRRARDLKRRALRRWEGERILRDAYSGQYGCDLDLEHPRTFSEKLFRRMVLMNRTGNSEFTPLVDKYLVRDYVAEAVGTEYLTELYWQGRHPAEIPFGDLPNEYVLKTNHASGQTIAVRGAVDRARAVQQLESWLKSNYYWVCREYQYFKIRPRVLVEELLDDGWDDGPLDYRFWCFDGVPLLIQVTNHRHDVNLFVDRDWRELDLHIEDQRRPASVGKPDNFTEMENVASALAAGFDFVRVDLYNVQGRVVFGEMTFTPRAGRFTFQPSYWDARLGEAWTLSASR